MIIRSTDHTFVLKLSSKSTLTNSLQKCHRCWAFLFSNSLSQHLTSLKKKRYKYISKGGPIWKLTSAKCALQWSADDEWEGARCPYQVPIKYRESQPSVFPTWILDICALCALCKQDTQLMIHNSWHHFCQLAAHSNLHPVCQSGITCSTLDKIAQLWHFLCSMGHTSWAPKRHKGRRGLGILASLFLHTESFWGQETHNITQCVKLHAQITQWHTWRLSLSGNRN